MVMVAKAKLHSWRSMNFHTRSSKPCQVSETEVLDMALLSIRGGFGATSSARLQSVPTAPGVETQFLDLGVFVFAWLLRNPGRIHAGLSMTGLHTIKTVSATLAVGFLLGDRT